MIKVEQLFVVVINNEKGDEGIMAEVLHDALMPFFTSRVDILEKVFLPKAREISAATKMPYKILKFENPENITDFFANQDSFN